MDRTGPDQTRQDPRYGFQSDGTRLHRDRPSQRWDSRHQHRDGTPLSPDDPKRRKRDPSTRKHHTGWLENPRVFWVCEDAFGRETISKETLNRMNKEGGMMYARIQPGGKVIELHPPCEPGLSPEEVLNEHESAAAVLQGSGLPS